MFPFFGARIVSILQFGNVHGIQHTLPVSYNNELTIRTTKEHMLFGLKLFAIY